MTTDDFVHIANTRGLIVIRSRHTAGLMIINEASEANLTVSDEDVSVMTADDAHEFLGSLCQGPEYNRDRQEYRLTYLTPNNAPLSGPSATLSVTDEASSFASLFRELYRPETVSNLTYWYGSTPVEQPRERPIPTASSRFEGLLED